MTATPIRQRYTIPWSTVTTNTNMLRNQGYFCDSVAGIDLLLPPNPNEGSIIQIKGIEGGFTITQGALVRIRIADKETTPGVGGSVEFENDWDYVTLVYQQSENIWVDLGFSGVPTVI